MLDDFRKQTKRDLLIEVLVGRVFSFILKFVGIVIVLNYIFGLNFSYKINLFLTLYLFGISTIFNFYWRKMWQKRFDKRLEKLHQE